MSNHYEDVTRHLIQLCKSEIMTNNRVFNVSSSVFYEIKQFPALILRGPTFSPNKTHDRESPETEIVPAVGEENEKIKIYENYSINDMEFDIILLSKRQKEIIGFQYATEKFLMKYGTITVDGNEYDVDVITPFTNATIPNYSNNKVISGRISIMGVKIVHPDYQERETVKQVEITPENI